MFSVNGLFGHIQRNNFKTLILILAFLVLSVGGTVGPRQLILRGMGVTPGSEHYEIIRQAIEHPVFGNFVGGGLSQAGANGAPGKPAPTAEPLKPRAPDAPLDLSQVPALQRPGAHLLFASPLE